ncbi:GNAT family N-acetyltransferase [Bacillaceae bacterium SIJ1]|nr:GNAT family N-acetyltransferase [Litoribacterium kuwaitense]
MEPEDWQVFHENDRDSEAARAAHMIYFPRSAAGTKAWSEQQATQDAEGDNKMLVIETVEGVVVGNINSHSCDPRQGVMKYGLGVFAEHRQQGYASEAIRLLLRYYFEELRYEKCVAHVYAFNTASCLLHERLGFTKEGVLRSMIYTEGKRYDEYIYGMLREEFQGDFA